MKTQEIHTIAFDRSGQTTDPIIDKIRQAARTQQWTGIAGIKQWAKETYRATLRTNIYNDWTRITFKTAEDMARFQVDLGVDAGFQMNPRLREIMVEAGYAAPEMAGRARQLAQLIVAECAQVTESFHNNKYDFTGNLELHEFMLKHFGVEP